MKTWIFSALVAVAAVACLLAVPAHAQTPAAGPVYKWDDWPHRLSIGATARYEFYSPVGQNTVQQDPHKEWVAGFVGAYTATKNVIFVIQSVYGADSKQLRTGLGITVPIYGGD